MNAERLLTHFDRLAEAPDAVPRLRRFVLDLAVRGKLVQQEPKDEPAATLLNRIRATRDDATWGKKRGALPPISDEEIPFEPPAGWAWARFADVALIQSNLVDPKDYPRLAHIAPDNIESWTGRLLPYETVAEAKVFSSKHFFKGGCILYSKIRPALAKAVVVDFDGLCSADMYPIRPFIDRGYLHRFMLSELFVAQSVSEDNRVAMPKINQAALSKVVVAVPPLAEQRRIVAKVDELMALCDRLEAAQAERESRRDRLVAASLHRLSEPANDATAFQSDARFALDYQARFTTRPEHVPQLRQTILNLAVRGKLVPQDPNDEPVGELLHQIQSTKVGLIRSGAVRRQRSIATSAVDDPPFVVPGVWRWAYVDDCFNVTGGIQKTPARAPKENSFPYLGVGNVYRGRLDLTEVKQFELFEGDLDRYRLAKGDLLVVEGNGSENEIGRCAAWSGEIQNCVHQNHIIRCRPFAPDLTPFVLTYLNSPSGIDVMKSLAVTSSGLYSLSVGKIRTVAIPLPPLSEQRRIVAKVNELMAVCDRLEAQLATVRTDSGRLLEAVLHEALAPVVEVLA